MRKAENQNGKIAKKRIGTKLKNCKKSGEKMSKFGKNGKKFQQTICVIAAFKKRQNCQKSGLQIGKFANRITAIILV